MEWWRKLAIAISLGCLFYVVLSSQILIIEGSMSFLEAVMWYIIMSFLTLYLYCGQFDGYDHLNTNKFSKLIFIICFPSLLVFGGLYASIMWVVNKVNKKK